MLDFIGDVHGEADLLTSLLDKLGYRLNKGVMFHPVRKAVLLGDLIDRGLKVRETLHLVKSMVEKGSAIVLMGNHELNALLFHTKQPLTEQPLRQHTEQHIRQHSATLRAFNNLEDEWRQWISWIANLPFFLDRTDVRAVHAYWDTKALSVIRAFPKPLDQNILVRISDSHALEHISARLIVAGPVTLPPANALLEHSEGRQNKKTKSHWWDAELQTSNEKLPPTHKFSLCNSEQSQDRNYPTINPPLFIGHYRLHLPNVIVPLATNLACLDYNAGSGGPLVAYRWSGEQNLITSNFVIVKP